MKSKKIMYIILLIILIVIIGAFAFVTVNRTERLDVNKSDNTNLGNRENNNSENRTEGLDVPKSDNTNLENKENNNSENIQVSGDDKKTTTVTTLDDGVLYSVSDKDVTADIVIGDNYFDTQISDININLSQYEGKTIEIEGMSLTNDPYTFVGRYSTVNLCAYCPAGYSYIEYEWKGDQTPELKEEESWLKVKGTLKRGNDNGMEYCYIDVSSLEVMNEKGLTTVNN